MAMSSVTAVPPVAAMHEHVQQRTGQQQQEGKETEGMHPVLREKENAAISRNAIVTNPAFEVKTHAALAQVRAPVHARPGDQPDVVYAGPWIGLLPLDS